ncbi:chemotaxis protein CheW [Atopococcus tabaci]|uniref:chemotaxis protein CheW n=1 Tax=Atopococcus tabaci TaxID=269774 RepID=UPI000406A91E|nr:chemotaxis protein CheW [Atopococcus tabaci]
MMQLIVFSLNNTYYSLPTTHVEEITNRLSSTKVPKSTEWVEGLVNLRGHVMTLVNMHNLLNIDEPEGGTCYNNTIIAQLDKKKVALMVDEVIGVTEAEEHDFQPAPSDGGQAVSSLVTLYEHVVNVIDLTNLFNENEGS